jgi:uncharacterized protein GlcG (DUF336 family)
MNARIRSVAQVALFVAVAFASSPSFAAPTIRCPDILAMFATNLQTALTNAIGGNGGLSFNMWAAIVNRDGSVCSVVFSGPNDRQEQWPGSRVISMQKAYAANAFSLDGLPLSTANLYSAVQPGGSLYGLQHSNPVDAAAAYAGNAALFGTGITDPAVGHKIGGINVFGGGLALYANNEVDGNGNPVNGVVGAIGVSGDTSCTDHIVAWKVRDALGLDFVPGGVSPTGDDNMIFDIVGSNGNFKSKSGFGHPDCGFGEKPIALGLPANFPVGP